MSEPGYVFWVAHGMIDVDDRGSLMARLYLLSELKANNWEFERTFSGNWRLSHPLNGRAGFETLREACQYVLAWDGDKFGEPPYVTPK